MGVQDVMPRGVDDFLRRISNLEAQLSAVTALAGSASALATAIQNGLGNLATSGTTWAGPVASPGTVSAATNITATHAITAGDDITSTNGTFWSLYALNNPVVTGYFALYVNSDGRFGRTPSARKYKQDIANFSPSMQAVFAIQLREFRLKQAVNELGDSAPVEHGLIAEELVDIGLDWLVLFGPDGEPEGIAYEKVALALIPVIQDHERRIAELETR